MGLLDKLKEGASKAADKAKETVEVTRLNSHVSGKKRDIDKSLLRIGELIYNAHQKQNLSAAEENVAAVCQEIDTLNDEIVLLELKIREVKNEKDCECGKVVALNTKFCPSCGHHFDQYEPVGSEANSAHLESNSCSGCGTKLVVGAKFCANCGKTA